MTAPRTLTVLVPALNEERNLASAVETARAVVSGRFDDHEILIVNDGSTDGTGAVADALASADPRVRVIHNRQSRNLGGAYKQAVAEARCEYLVMIPGDNESSPQSLIVPLEAVGQAEIVIPYVPGDRRSRGRIVLSRTYVALLNRLSGLKIRYYNGTVIHRVSNLREITIETDSFAYQSEVLIKLLRRGKSFVEVPVEITDTGAVRKTKALRLKNVVGVGKALVRLALLPR